MKALLLSGGIDSVAICYWLKPEHAITIDYGQKAAETEISISQKICKELGVRHSVLRINCSAIGSGCMAGKDVQNYDPKCPTPEWWPFRNQLLITFAAAKAMQIGCDEVIIGTVNTDCRHKDGTTEFIEVASKLLCIQEGGIKLSAPAINFTSTELVIKSKIPIELLAWTHSCHTGNFACGECPGCIKNAEIWAELTEG